MITVESKSGIFAYAFSVSHPTEEKILGFHELRSGWNFGEGLPIGRARVQEALKLYRAVSALGLNESDAFPGLSGEIRVTFYSEGHYLEFTLEGDSTWTAVRETEGVEVDCSERLSFDEAVEVAKSFFALSCITSDSSLSRITGMSASTGSPVWLSGPPQTEEYPFFSQNVPSQPRAPFACTSLATIKG